MLLFLVELSPFLSLTIFFLKDVLEHLLVPFLDLEFDVFQVLLELIHFGTMHIWELNPLGFDVMHKILVVHPKLFKTEGFGAER